MVVLKWHFKDLWKKNKVVTHVTKIFFIIIIEMKSQQSFSLTKSNLTKGVAKLVAPFCVGKIRFKEGIA